MVNRYCLGFRGNKDESLQRANITYVVYIQLSIMLLRSHKKFSEVYGYQK
jgi:hypothetical protein